MLDLEKIRDVALEVLAPYGVKRLSVFGSVARGDDTPESDIDLLVELDKPLGLQWFGLEAELAQRIGRKVEMVSERDLSPYIRPYVAQDSVVLFDSDNPTRATKPEPRKRTPPFRKDPKVQLFHIRDYTEHLLLALDGVPVEDFVASRMLQNGVAHCLEKIGNACMCLPIWFREQHPEIPWDDYLGMRHRLVDFFQPDLDVMWQIAQRELPTLRNQIERLLKIISKAEETP